MRPVLLRVLRAPLADAAAVDAALQGGAEGLPEVAARHGLAAFVAWKLSKAGVQLPGDAGASLSRTAFGARMKAQRIRALTVQVLDALASRGIAPVVLKGAALANRIYPDPLTRLSTDVDVWVQPGEVALASAALVQLGLTEVEAPEDPDDPSEHQRVFSGPPGVVELHFRALSTFGSPVEASEGRAHAVEDALDGRRYLRLPPEDELAYLCVHAAHHFLQRLGWLLDLALYLESVEVDWDRFVDACRRTGHPELCHVSLDAVHRALGAPVPEAVLEALAPPRWKRWMASQVLFTDERLESAFLATHKSVWAAAKLLYGRDRLWVLRLFGRRLRERLGPGAPS